MLLLDLSSMVIPEIIVLVTKDKIVLTEDIVRRVTLSQIIQYKKKFSVYGNTLVCADGRNYWRKETFPNYKQNRKKIRAKSTLDWELFHLLFNKIKKEITEQLPYRIMEHDKLEADDIIAVLAVKYAQAEPIMIVSTDKDLIQLQYKSNRIHQWSPKAKKRIRLKEKEYSLVEHIMRGDSSDGIPNILSDDDVFLDDTKRQKSVMATWVAEAKKLSDPETIAPNKVILDKYKRNRTLIDLDCIPEKYKQIIVDSYANPPVKMKANLLSYLIKHKLRHIIDKIGV